MKIAKLTIGAGGAPRLGVVEGDHVAPLVLDQSPLRSLSDLLATIEPIATAERLPRETLIPLAEVKLLPPLDAQEVWAAGVTYKRSQTARMEESAAAASCYDRVYLADRPELFFKATPHRVRGSGQPLRIRRDASWNVPEPEVTLVLNRSMRIVGLTVGNDMSSRDIEGENPLYLPQAKCYDAAAGIGPWIRLVDGPIDRSQLDVRLEISRGGEVVFAAETSAAEMARGFEELVAWLARDNSFPHGVYLMTGTGVVPDSDFTLAHGDTVAITVETIGTLTNPIIQAGKD